MIPKVRSVRGNPIEVVDRMLDMAGKKDDVLYDLGVTACVIRAAKRFGTRG
jgi:hypothetical protein